MAKVVGKDKSVTKRCTCQNCSAIVEYLPSEVKRVDGRDYTGGADGREYILCPDCGKEIVLRSW